MIQPFFDYTCNAWYPNLKKSLKTRLQAAQNKCIRFCLKLGDKTSTLRCLINGGRTLINFPIFLLLPPHGAY